MFFQSLKETELGQINTLLERNKTETPDKKHDEKHVFVQTECSCVTRMPLRNLYADYGQEFAERGAVSVSGLTWYAPPTPPTNKSLFTGTHQTNLDLMANSRNK